MRTARPIVLTLSAFNLAACAGLLIAGPLNPPAGPVTSTYKTLSEVEPRTAINATNTPGDADSVFRISQPGSYYLAANLTGASGKHGIEIAASNVTVDLNGFQLVGVPGSLNGVVVSLANQSAISLSNGTCRAWGGSGVDLASSAPRQLRLERLHSSGNTGSGIRAFENATLLTCTSSANGGIGFDLYSNTAVSQCRAESNTLSGFDMADHTAVSECRAINNGGYGFTTTGRSTLVNCEASDNSSFGINVGDRSSVRECSLMTNDRGGIKVFNDCVVSNNTITGHTVDPGACGIEAVGGQSHIDSNTLIDNGLGFVVTGTANIITRNRVSGSNSPWTVEFGNRIFVVQWGPGGGVYGGSGGSQGSTDPNANFTY